MEELSIKETIKIISSQQQLSGFGKDLCAILYDKGNEVDRTTFKELIKKYNLAYKEIKEELMDIILSYARIILQDGVISNEEIFNLKYLKRLFKIPEGDFYNLRYDEIREIVEDQLNKIYVDGTIDKNEAVHKVMLQELFDLNYDQMLELVNPVAQAALRKGAILEELDTYFPDYPSFNEEDSSTIKRIHTNNKYSVWNRDRGVCVQCGSKENLKFDHIVPISKGGSNTHRNVQLLCEDCLIKRLNKTG